MAFRFFIVFFFNVVFCFSQHEFAMTLNKNRYLQNLNPNNKTNTLNHKIALPYSISNPKENTFKQELEKFVKEEINFVLIS